MKFTRLSAALASVYDQFLNQGPQAMMAMARSVPLTASPTGTAPLVTVFVHCKDKTDLGKVTGVKSHQATGKVRTATLPLDRLEDLANVTGVTRIAVTRRLRPLMDLASTKVNLPTYRAGNPTGRTGKGVLVGIIDTGIDSTHTAFAGRILSIWDQTIAGTGWGTTNYGKVLTGAALSASDDVDGHGTHVAGIAAGSHTTYGGVAPDADLLVVKTNFQDAGIADGVRYIFDQADKLDRPAVVNLSLGGHWDAHDGTDDLAASLDALTGAGRIVVAAAGNEGGDSIHAGVNVPAGGTTEVLFQTIPSSQPASPPWVVLNGWYSGNAQLEVSTRTSAGDVTPFQAVATTGSPVQNYPFTAARVRIATPSAAVNVNNDHQFQVELEPGPFNNKVQGGTWRLRLRDPGTAAVRVDVWSIVESGRADAAFQSPAVTNEMKVGSPGSASSVITVGSYTTRNQWVDSGGTNRAVGLALDDISDFSSPGPLRTAAEKPDLAAPGAMIISARSAASTPEPRNLIAPGLMVEAGTSMACPFVTGLIALLLQQKATLTPTQVRNKLRAASAVPGLASGTFDPKWGYGLIDASLL